MVEKKAKIAQTVSQTATNFFRESELSGDATIKVDGYEVSLTHLDKKYWPDDGYTKGDLLKYYFDVSKYILPHLKDRPLILKRFPNGIKKPPFFQHNLKNHPDFIKTVLLEMEDGHGVHYAVCDNTAELLYLANLGTIPQNPWLSRIDEIDNPDICVLDLDPKQTDFSVVCEVAVVVRDLLNRFGLKSYPKTSGSSGIHLYIPIKPKYDFEIVAEFAESVATLVARENPEIATRERLPSKRKKGQVYVDHLQNAYGKSVASPYSVRERAGATVSAPLEWSEVEKGKVRIEDFTIKTMPKRLDEKGDLFKDVLRRQQSLDRAIEKIKRLVE